ncbi:Cytochrome P450 [seawater metagenome]|uniref:Cytochrome P450 n=1 Tax=seawater metagenome TaxID=1561972 RepID=A0A5E8CH74_9ZZZZ
MNNIFNKDFLSNLKDHTNPNLIEKIATPLIDYDKYDLLQQINIASQEGKDHLMYTQYISKYGENQSSNLLIPLLDHYSKTPFIRDFFIISNPIDAERLSRKHIKKASNFKFLLGDSIISTTDNKHWRSQRNDYIESFFPNTLEKLIPISNKRAKECSSLLWQKSNKGRTKVNINDFLLNETQAQLQLALFGFNNEFQDKMNPLIRDDLSGFSNNKALSNNIKKLLKEVKNADGPLSEIMKERTDKTKTEDFFNMILFTFAGHDTTGHTLTWLIYELAKNINLQKKLQDEVDNFWMEQGNKEITFNDLKKLKFMTRCIMETLRLWPAVTNGTFREIEDDDEITGLNNKKVTINKGSLIQIINWTRHRNPILWGNDVLDFNPDREFKENEIWENEGLKASNPSSDRFSPFSYSPRDCLGKTFAQIEMRLILLNLMKNYNFILTSKQSSAVFNGDYLGINRATLYPLDIYAPEHCMNKKFKPYNAGLYVHILKRIKNSKL